MQENVFSWRIEELILIFDKNFSNCVWFVFEFIWQYNMSDDMDSETDDTE